MTNAELVTKLKELSNTSPALRDVLYLFAARERARASITVLGLKQSMRRQKFEYPVEDYRGVIKTMADLEIGIIDRTPKGVIRGLRGLRLSLPSLGKAVHGTGTLHAYRARRHYKQVAAAVSVPTPEPRAKRTPRPYQLPSSKVVATVLNPKGEVIANITFAADANKDDIAEFFAGHLDRSVKDDTPRN